MTINQLVAAMYFGYWPTKEEVLSALGHDPRICGMSGDCTFVFNKKF